MLNQTNIRSVLAKVVEPVAKFLLKIGLTPNIITALGTLGVVVSAFVFLPRGSFIIGPLLIAFFVLTDMLDGTMARLSDSASQWGALLDSTMDRIADGAVFLALLIWFARTEQWVLVGLMGFILVGSFVVSYIKARAQSVGLECDVGIAERTERLVVVLVATFVAGLGVPYILAIGLWLLAALVAITVWQRLRHVYVEATALEGSS